MVLLKMISSGDEAELKVKIPFEDGDDPPPPTLVQDRKLYDELLRVEFRGPRYDVIAQELWTYGIRTLTAWMRSGAISHHCHRYNVAFDASEIELSSLARTSEVREALAVDSVTAAAPRFLERSLRGGEWNPDKGASMFTFFVGGCVMAFGDVFKTWSRKRRREVKMRGYGLLNLTDIEAVFPGQLSLFDDPAETVASRDTLRRILSEATPEAAAICTLMLRRPELNQREIGALLGGMSARAVEGQLRRLRGTARVLAASGKISRPQFFEASQR
ncbi:hypothetical protein JHN55_32450 [Streptomyces sp. MBT56]|uniref:hypothetical protein n=1 Tax=unclassified Streptomyces TaxID=2593676 RepID=UPI00190C54C7|nr:MULTISPECIES: hypothetical protein [unclassified Streptomyces]MBK3561159.1 hypothetical protein [Streptomyces sp. MBT56]MBK3601670.1 hypothetical protein [Streptomyces sp. MBT54]MBK3614488.1 hypothetical protein [Streptomyces sp. MBT98]